MPKKLKIVSWASDLGMSKGGQRLGIDTGKRPVKMKHSVATGESLVTNGLLGADTIRLAAGEKFVPHTHPGDHLLLVIAGKGTITYDGNVYKTQAGQIYMVEGSVPHAVGAISDHVIIAVGHPHKTVDSNDRMTPVEYKAVTANLGSLNCLICGIKVGTSKRLHDTSCTHCPCPDC